MASYGRLVAVTGSFGLTKLMVVLRPVMRASLKRVEHVGAQLNRPPAAHVDVALQRQVEGALEAALQVVVARFEADACPASGPWNAAALNWRSTVVAAAAAGVADDPDAPAVVRRAGQVHVAAAVVCSCSRPRTRCRWPRSRCPPAASRWRSRPSVLSSGDRAVQVRHVPHEVRLDDVRLGVVVAEQPVGLGLIGPDRHDAVGGVLQPRRGVLAIVEADGVVEPERQAVAEPPLQRQLQRVIGPLQPARRSG